MGKDSLRSYSSAGLDNLQKFAAGMTVVSVAITLATGLFSTASLDSVLLRGTIVLVGMSAIARLLIKSLIAVEALQNGGRRSNLGGILFGRSLITITLLCVFALIFRSSNYDEMSLQALAVIGVVLLLDRILLRKQ